MRVRRHGADQLKTESGMISGDATSDLSLRVFDFTYVITVFKCSNEVIQQLPHNNSLTGLLMCRQVAVSGDAAMQT